MTTPEPPPVERIDTGELRAALENVLPRRSGARRRVERLRRRLSVYSSSYPIENLEVTLDGGERVALVLKDLSPASQLAAARRVRPAFLYDPLREIETYRRILGRLNLGTPVCHGAVVDPGRERYWLFLERVSGPLLWQRGRMGSWEAAARWLARLHSLPVPAGRSADYAHWRHLLRYDEPFLRTWLTRAGSFLRRRPGAVDPAARRRFHRLAGRYDRVIQRLLELPGALIHGEFYPSNVILRAGPGGRQVCPVDWEVAALAPGLVDLGALTSGEWPESGRRAMVAAYRGALEPSRGASPSMAELLEGVDYCQLHIAVQMLGWAADWSPPERHARNWLSEALRIAEKLGL